MVAALYMAALPILSFVAGKLCSDDCGSSHNGVCEDGGKCGFGTDCADCGQREYCCSTSITVCNEDSDVIIQREVNHRLGAAAFPSEGLVPRSTCVPITCNVHESCSGGCDEMPSCLPMAQTDMAYAWNTSDYVFSFSRSMGDQNVGLLPDHWFPNRSCAVSDAASSSWNDRFATAIYRGGISGNFNPWQEMRGMRGYKLMRKDFVEKFKSSSVVNVSSDDATQTANGEANGGLQPKDLMRHRCIVYLEGNDVGSSIYWLLGSGSLVLAPEALTAQSMFNIQPWVHYIPFKNDMSDVESRVQTYCGSSTRIGASAEAVAAKSVATQQMLYPEDDNAHPDKVAPSKMVDSILKNARDYFGDICDLKREAKRVYRMLQRYKSTTSNAAKMRLRRQHARGKL